MKTLSVIVVVLAMFNSLAAAQSTVSIISPSTDLSVAPGQTIPVTIKGNLDILVLDCKPPLIATRLPPGTSPDVPPVNSMEEWSVLVPQNIDPGDYYIRAEAAMLRDKNNGVSSNPVKLHVPLFALPISIAFDKSSLLFRYVGDTDFLSVIAKMPDGTSIDVTNISETVLTTSPNLARSETEYTALAAGNGSITATVTVNGASVSTTMNVVIPQNVRGDLNSDGKVDIDDLNLLLGFTGIPATSSNDARDLNHDGKIDALDARILVTLFTKPRGQ